ncbi:hypothetical protein DD565_11950 [Vibrio cholerae]|nr:hypothetical protein [Vibrio cholerae]RBM59287.1 hypothetical protein DLR67_12025 [Vibrio paracholerae]MCD1187267.1 hypothetical protein [Vibrio cholerae]MVB18102.1 hypothetical protein [Vibrio cholerae]MVB21800.1 hypothetical protein [Vibrio cholerae]
MARFFHPNHSVCLCSRGCALWPLSGKSKKCGYDNNQRKHHVVWTLISNQCLSSEIVRWAGAVVRLGRKARLNL